MTMTPERARALADEAQRLSTTLMGHAMAEGPGDPLFLAELAEAIHSLLARRTRLSRRARRYRTALHEEYARTALFSDCLHRAHRLWARAHPFSSVMPDGAANFVWLAELVARAEERVGPSCFMCGSPLTHVEGARWLCPSCLDTHWINS